MDRTAMGRGAFCCGQALCPLLLVAFAVLAMVSYRSDSATHWVLKKSGDIDVRVGDTSDPI